jgi:hypothetical protein
MQELQRYDPYSSDELDLALIEIEELVVRVMAHRKQVQGTQNPDKGNEPPNPTGDDEQVY